MIDTSKVGGKSTTKVTKKFLQNEYQLVFEFIIKALLPRLENKIIASSVKLSLIEFLSRLPTLMKENMKKVIYENEGKI